jgi:hypothetical protein
MPLAGPGADEHGIAGRLRQVVRAAGGNRVVAERSGVPIATVNRYVRTNGGMKVEALRAIAKACSVSLEWVVVGDQIHLAPDPASLATMPPGFGEPPTDLTPPAANRAPASAGNEIDLAALAKAAEIVMAIHESSEWRDNPKAMAQRIATTYAVLSKPPISGD